MNRLTSTLTELVGSAALVAIVVGSGIMGTNLSDDRGVVLLINALSTVAGLAILIWVCGPVSGAHFNPIVTIVAALRRQLDTTTAVGYVLAQVIGAIVGAIVANIMFELPAINLSVTSRGGAGQWLGEVIATVGLLLVIQLLPRRNGAGYVFVPLWIGSAYFFTSSTSFANPAVTIGRGLSDTFAGIAPASIAMFIVAQCVGGVIVWLGFRNNTH